jgi:hypothetical protein
MHAAHACLSLFHRSPRRKYVHWPAGLPHSESQTHCEAVTSERQSSAHVKMSSSSPLVVLQKKDSCRKLRGDLSPHPPPMEAPSISSGAGLSSFGTTEQVEPSLLSSRWRLQRRAQETSSAGPFQGLSSRILLSIRTNTILARGSRLPSIASATMQ